MIILGIDPGTLKIGFGVIRMDGNHLKHIAHGVIKPPPKDPVHLRLRHVHESLSEVIKTYTPVLASIENAFVGKNIQSTLRIGEGRGAALVIAALNDLDVVSFSPKEIKKAVTGNGNAHKVQVQAMIKTLLNLKVAPESDDASDALAMAVCAAHGLHRKNLKIRS